MDEFTHIVSMDLMAGFQKWQLSISFQIPFISADQSYFSNDDKRDERKGTEAVLMVAWVPHIHWSILYSDTSENDFDTPLFFFPLFCVHIYLCG